VRFLPILLGIVTCWAVILGTFHNSDQEKSFYRLASICQGAQELSLSRYVLGVSLADGVYELYGHSGPTYDRHDLHCYVRQSNMTLIEVVTNGPGGGDALLSGGQ
jgi:hypothetical protein